MQINADQAHLRKKNFQMKEPFPYLFELTRLTWITSTGLYRENIKID